MSGDSVAGETQKISVKQRFQLADSLNAENKTKTFMYRKPVYDTLH